MSLLFNKQMHDFGTVAKDSVQQTTFEFLGSETVVASDFVTSCTCTAGMYNPASRVYTVGLKTDTLGDKSTTIKVQNNTFLILKMTVV
jgi:hypothetical protein